MIKMYNQDILKAIIKGAYREIKEKEINGYTKEATVQKIVKMIQEEVKKDVD